MHAVRSSRSSYFSHAAVYNLNCPILLSVHDVWDNWTSYVLIGKCCSHWDWQFQLKNSWHVHPRVLDLWHSICSSRSCGIINFPSWFSSSWAYDPNIWWIYLSKFWWNYSLVNQTVCYLCWNWVEYHDPVLVLSSLWSCRIYFSGQLSSKVVYCLVKSNFTSLFSPYKFVLHLTNLFRNL